MASRSSRSGILGMLSLFLVAILVAILTVVSVVKVAVGGVIDAEEGMLKCEDEAERRTARGVAELQDSPAPGDSSR